MGSTNPAKQGRARILRTRTQMMWIHVPADYLRNVIQDVTASGCAIVLGRTSNGSALSVCILAGNQKLRDYIGSMDDIEPILDGMMADLDIDQVASAPTQDQSS